MDHYDVNILADAVCSRVCERLEPRLSKLDGVPERLKHVETVQEQATADDRQDALDAKRRPSRFKEALLTAFTSSLTVCLFEAGVHFLHGH